MKQYRVTFFKKGYEMDKAIGKLVPTGKLELLGAVTVDDMGCSNTFPVTAKAFRQANDNCLNSDHVEIIKL